MNERDDSGVGVFLQCVFHSVRVNGFSPRAFDDDRGAFAAFDVFDHATAKDAVSADDDFVARSDHVDEAAFHANGTGPGDRVGQLVVCLEGIT